jgi:hypothetical protein
VAAYAGGNLRRDRTLTDSSGTQRTAGATIAGHACGEFRIFDLPPADYYVHATLDARSDTQGASLGYVPTYYPGTASHTEAQQVRLSASEELTGIVFPLVTTRTSSVSGVVRYNDGTPALLAMVIVRERSGDIAPMMGTSAAAVTKPDGSFTVTNVPPGAYVVEAQAITSESRASATADVVVSGRDIGGWRCSSAGAPRLGAESDLIPPSRRGT